MAQQERNLNNLKPGETRVLDGRLWARCMDCRKIARIDGWFRGWHWCELQ